MGSNPTASAKNNASNEKGGMRLGIFLVILFCTGWFSGSTHIPIDLDELAWVHDAEVYQWRISNDWNKFRWNTREKSVEWSDEDFRLFDQPHLVKYIYGFVLSTTNINPWNNQNRANNLGLFINQKVSGQYLLTDDSSPSVFGQVTIDAIIICRLVSTTAGVLFFFILYFFLTYRFSILLSSTTLLLLTTNPTLYYNLHLATSDSISLFFITITLIFFYFLFFNTHINRKARFILLFLSAISAAVAVSTKINGWLLAYVFLIGQILLDHGYQWINWKIFLIKTGFWFLLFIGTYVYLQPELWTSIPNGLLRFFSHRFTQQDQFVYSFGAMGVFEYHKWLFALFTQSSHFIVIVFKYFFLLIALIKLIKVSISIFPKKIYLLKQVIIVGTIWLQFFYYARIGFDRYAIWPIIILTILSSWIITRQHSNLRIPVFDKLLT